MTATAPTLADIEAARARLAGHIVRTPLVRLTDPGCDNEVWLKLETLQPIGSFKLRGAGNRILATPPAELAAGVYTASSGNMAQGVAWMARVLGIPARVIVPDNAPEAKLAAIRALGGAIDQVPFAAWWQVLLDNGRAGELGRFVHPVSEPEVMAGNGTIALEIMDDLPDVDTVIVPFGGGGLACGIAAGMHALRPGAEIYACEAEGAAPLAAALAAGHPVDIDYRQSFVSGIGSATVLPTMWPLARDLLAGSVVAPIAEIEAALRDIVRQMRILPEGAGAAALAAARRSGLRGRKIVCIVSGSGIAFSEVARIMAAGE